VDRRAGRYLIRPPGPLGVVQLEQLALSGQCGFSSTVETHALTRDEQIAKLALIGGTAAEVWG
jgi:5-methyltetrahydropteroyltriglutamate--homocysteine methyltransferase